MPSNKLINLDESFASHPKSQYWSDKNTVKPYEIPKNTYKKYYFNCNICNHEIYVRIGEIIKFNSWCIYCANKKLCDNENCKICFEKSFASNKCSVFWSSKNNTSPRYVSLNSNKKYFFNCECKHEIYKNLNNIKKDKLGCPYCDKKSIILCNDDNCIRCYEKSFASHPLSKYWSLNNPKTPRQVGKGTEVKYEFNCICGHTYKKELYSITTGGNGCVFCAGQKLCDDDKCQKCFEKSFASSKDVGCFSDKNIVKPREVFKNSNIKYIFTCKKCKKDYSSTLCHFTCGNRRCPYCVNKTEAKLFDSLVVFYSSLKQQIRYDWCRMEKNNRYMPFDFVLEDYKIIIELDGEQHFKQISNWKAPEIQQQNDKYKMKKANENNYSVIRILQDDVYNDKYNWLEELKYTIEKIKAGGNIVNLYLCKNNEYNCYKD